MSEFGGRRQILALSGGGYRGLYAATFLGHCESEFRATCRERFDLFAGTSIGALLAAGLALGVPASSLVEQMRKHGPLIFPQSPGAFLKRAFHSAPYDTEIVRGAINETLAETALQPLNAIKAPLVITVVNYTTGRAEVLRSAGIDPSAASPVPLGEAILASAAAPTFFPMRKIATDQYADGGLVANAPDLVALSEMIAFRSVDLSSTYLLSIGTAGRRAGAALHDAPLNPGVLSWFFVRGLIQTTMAAQESLALAQAVTLLGSRHLRVDEEPLENQVDDVKSLDKASQRATDTLTSLANLTWSKLKAEKRLRDFFRR